MRTSSGQGLCNIKRRARVTNGIGDEGEVTVTIRNPYRALGCYKAAAILIARRVLPLEKPWKVEWL